MSELLLRAWLIAFLFTQAIEIPIYLWALRVHGSRPRWLLGAAAPPGRLPLRWRVLLAFLASALTHPVVWFVMPELFINYLTMVLVAESFAVLTEAALLSACGLRHALGWSLLANAASVSFGLLSRYLFGIP